MHYFFIYACGCFCTRIFCSRSAILFTGARAGEAGTLVALLVEVAVSTAVSVLAILAVLLWALNCPAVFDGKVVAPTASKLSVDFTVGELAAVEDVVTATAVEVAS